MRNAVSGRMHSQRCPCPRLSSSINLGICYFTYDKRDFADVMKSMNPEMLRLPLKIPMGPTNHESVKGI